MNLCACIPVKVLLCGLQEEEFALLAQKVE